jgi:hypothetical protein
MVPNYDFGKPETNFMKKSFSYSAASLWNDLSITENYECARANEIPK